MQVECPHCNTVFKVTEELLQAADGMVRCGLCHEVFDARESSDAEITSAAPAPAPSRDSDSKPSTDEPGDKHHDKPQHRPEDRATVSDTETDAEAVTTADVDADTHTNKHTGTKAEPTTIEAETEAEDFFNGVQSKLIPDEYRIPKLKQTHSVWRDVGWSLAILLLTASLFVEYAWFNRNELIKHDELKPWIKQLCLNIDCNRLGLKDTSEIEMQARNIYSHPNVDEALMISVTLVNHAAFAQRYPDINIDFSDVRGKIVASRTFSPKEYMQHHGLELLYPGKSIDFHLEIHDPGAHAMTYEFSFL